MSKSINLVSSVMKNVCVDMDDDGAIWITVVGSGSDGSGEYPAENLVIMWEDLPVSVQNVGNTFLKHLSREFNKFVANEDSDTWVEP